MQKLNGLLIKRTVTRQAGLYIKLLVCLTCAVVLISCVLIFRDSNVYGQEQYLEKVTRHADFVLSGLSEEECELFPLTGQTSFYEDGSLYIQLGKNEQPDLFLRELRQVFKDNALSCEIVNYYHINRSEETPEFTVFILAAVLVLAAFAALSMMFMYRVFLNAREADIETLSRLGASAGQIGKLLRTELYILTGLALLLGVSIANLVMAGSLAHYVSIDNTAYVPIAYHYSPWSFLMTLVIVALIHAVTAESGIRQMSRRYGAGKGMSRRGKNQHLLVGLKEQPLRRVYTRLSLRRNRAHNAACFFITLPLLVIGMVVSAYLGMYTPEEDEKLTGELALYRSNVPTEVTLDQFEALFAEQDAIAGVSYFIYRTDYSMRLDNRQVELVTSNVDQSGAEITVAEFGVMDEMRIAQYCGAEQAEGTDRCVVPMGYGLEVGDVVTLEKEGASFSLTVGGVYDTGGRNSALKMFPVYVEKAVYERVTGEAAVPYVVSITLAENGDGDAVLDLLPDEVTEAYSIRDNRKIKNDYRDIYRSISEIAGVMAVMLGIVEVLLIFSYISLHMEEKKDEIRILHKLGCRSREVLGLYLYQYLLRFAAVFAVGMVLSGFFVSYMCSSLRQSLLFNGATVVPPVLMVAVLLAAYLGSVLYSIQNMQRMENE